MSNGLVAEATIKKAGIKPGSGGGYGTPKGNVLMLEFNVELPAARPVPTFEQWESRQSRWSIDDTIKKCRASKEPAKPKGAKRCSVEWCTALVVKGEEHVHKIQCDDCNLTFEDEEAHEGHDCNFTEKCTLCGKDVLEDPDDDEDACACPIKWCCTKHQAAHRVEYEREAQDLTQQNAKAWAATQNAGIFLALIDTPIRVTLEPLQGGMAEMFPMLASGE